MRTPTIRDVARKAEVGIATVSRVLNDSPAVTQETRQRVLDVIAELNYQPNPIAKQLSKGRTNAVGVTLPFLTYPSFVERLRGVQHALADTEYELILYAADTPRRRNTNLTAMSQRPRVDGVLIVSVPINDSHVQMFLKSNVPTVLVDVFHKDFSRVFVDDVAGGYMATKHLVGLGHRRIAFIGDVLEDEFEFLAMRERFKGYRKALEEHGIPFREEYHRQRPHGREEAREMAGELFVLEEPPTAVFAGSDTQAIGFMDEARARGLRIPQDVSVIGYDGIRDAEYLQLTTIQQPLYNSGVEGVDLLLSVIEQPDQPVREIRLPVELAARATTAPPGGPA
jgi:DNA-binding LacI/PurR family transcriptional regulator